MRWTRACFGISFLCTYQVAGDVRIGIERGLVGDGFGVYGSNSIDQCFSRWAVHCADSNIKLDKQTEIDNFRLIMIRVSDFMVWVVGNDVTDLSGLSNITSVGGDTIIGNSLLLLTI